MSDVKQLKWEDSTEFTFKGQEFSQLHNTLKFIIESPLYAEQLEKARQVTAIGQLFELSTKKLNEGITSGIVVETEIEQTPASEHIMD